MLSHLIQLFTRDLDRLKDELNAYSNEADLWKLSGSINNTPGNLALHLIGNLNHFIGSKLGNTGYVRDRPAEFADKNIPLADLTQMINATKTMLTTTLSGLNHDDLEKPFVIENFNETPTTGFWLIHLTTHLNYHLGQINYHRRMIK